MMGSNFRLSRSTRTRDTRYISTATSVSADSGGRINPSVNDIDNGVGIDRCQCKKDMPPQVGIKYFHALLIK